MTQCLASESSTLFQQERDSGALELLLVAPLTSDQLILTRLRAFWRRFFWPVGLAVILNWFIRWRDMAWSGDFSYNTFLLVNYVAAPLIGCWASLRVRTLTSSFLGSVLVTVGLGALVPEMGDRVFSQTSLLAWPWFFEYEGFPPSMNPWCQRVPQMLQFMIAAACWAASRRMLAERTFVTKSQIIELPAPPAVKWQAT